MLSLSNTSLIRLAGVSKTTWGRLGDILEKFCAHTNGVFEDAIERSIEEVLKSFIRHFEPVLCL